MLSLFEQATAALPFPPLADCFAELVAGTDVEILLATFVGISSSLSKITPPPTREGLSILEQATAALPFAPLADCFAELVTGTDLEVFLATIAGISSSLSSLTPPPT